MYIVIFETSYEIWYKEFDSLESAKDYIKEHSDYKHLTIRLFKIDKELEC